VEISVYNPEIDFDSTLCLYAAVGWTAYTVNPERLREALVNSSLVLIIRRADRVVGLVRCISDGQTICYIQDILVVPEYQRLGIGKGLLQEALNHYFDVRQVVLMGVGFREIKDDLRGFVLVKP